MDEKEMLFGNIHETDDIDNKLPEGNLLIVAIAVLGAVPEFQNKTDRQLVQYLREVGQIAHTTRKIRNLLK